MGRSTPEETPDEQGMSTPVMVAQLEALQRSMSLQTAERHQANKTIVETLAAMQARSGRTADVVEKMSETLGRVELAIAGDESMGHRGLVSRMAAVEQISHANRMELRLARRVGAAVIAVIVALAGVVAWLANVAQLFRKNPP